MRRSIVAAVLALAATGCGGPAVNDVPDPSGSATAASASPGAVAAAYSQALFSGGYDRAESYVRPSDQGLLKVLFAGMAQSSVRATGLGVGAVHTQAGSGTVVLIGKMCSSAPVPKGAAGNPHPHEKCTENKNPVSTDPAFKVSVCEDSGKWYVCFPEFDRAAQAAHSGAPVEK
ncbi:hypothetical protein [Streptomyces acidiscabies]|uniref:hypothetical protein n=1 Tax=Streptomyces acidiscabies TaxID=42234 RepID=UPI0038F6DC89